MHKNRGFSTLERPKSHGTGLHRFANCELSLLRDAVKSCFSLWNVWLAVHYGERYIVYTYIILLRFCYTGIKSLLTHGEVSPLLLGLP